MSDASHSTLYNKLFLEHGRHPHNFSVLESATHQAEGHNPMCGDKLIIYAEQKDNALQAVSFQGEGCILCLASASMMTDILMGQSTAYFLQTKEELQKIWHAELTGVAVTEALQPFQVLSAYPTRQKCALLAWEALHDAITEKSVHATELSDAVSEGAD